MATSLQVTRSARLILAHRNDNKGKDYENDLFLPFGKGLSPSHLIVNAHQVEIHPFGWACFITDRRHFHQTTIEKNYPFLRNDNPTGDLRGISKNPSCTSFTTKV
jgi:hypothetical protein